MKRVAILTAVLVGSGVLSAIVGIPQLANLSADEAGCRQFHAIGTSDGTRFIPLVSSCGKELVPVSLKADGARHLGLADWVAANGSFVVYSGYDAGRNELLLYSQPDAVSTSEPRRLGRGIMPVLSEEYLVFVEAPDDQRSWRLASIRLADAAAELEYWSPPADVKSIFPPSVQGDRVLVPAETTVGKSIVFELSIDLGRVIREYEDVPPTHTVHLHSDGAVVQYANSADEPPSLLFDVYIAPRLSAADWSRLDLAGQRIVGRSHDDDLLVFDPATGGLLERGVLASSGDEAVARAPTGMKIVSAVELHSAAGPG